jgi:hypothetical protein
LSKTTDKCRGIEIFYYGARIVNIIDIFFTSEWVTVLFTVIFASIAAKIFVLPLSFEKDRVTRIVLMKRREERKYDEENVYNY